MRYLLYLLPLIIFCGAGVAFWWALDSGRDPSRLPSALIDRQAPEFALPPIEGIDTPGLASSDLATGEVTLVNVFASWCVPCRAEHPILVRLNQQEGIRLVGINYQDEAEDAARFLDELTNPYSRIGADPRGRTSLDWGLTGVPETFVIDGSGRIRYRHVGPIHPAEVESLILPAVEEARK